MTIHIKAASLYNSGSAYGTVTKETKCYYTVEFKKFFSNGNSWIVKLFKREGESMTESQNTEHYFSIVTFDDHLNFDKTIDRIDNGDLNYERDIEGISYYLGQSDHSFIIAIDHINKLALETDFIEIDDFLDVVCGGILYESDYKIVNHNNRLVCKFEAV